MKRKATGYISLLICFLFFLPSLSVHAEEAGIETRYGAVCKIVGAIVQEAEPDISVLNRFTDLGQYASDSSLAFAVQNGILKGYEDNTLRPEGSITRAEFAVMLLNASALFEELDILVPYEEQLIDVPSWAQAAVRFCVERGLMMGYGDGFFGCYDNLTPLQSKMVVHRLTEGLLTYEKYTVLDLYGMSPLKMREVMADFSPEKLSDELPDKFSGNPMNKVPLSAAQADEIIYDMQAFCDFALYGSFDYRDYDTQEKIDVWLQKAKDIGWLHKELPKDRGIYAEINNGVRQEAFLVISPENCKYYTNDDTGTFKKEVQGYLYRVIYTNSQKPEHIELGKWYRQTVYINHHGTGDGWSTWTCVGGTAEDEKPVPEELLNN